MLRKNFSYAYQLDAQKENATNHLADTMPHQSQIAVVDTSSVTDQIPLSNINYPTNFTLTCNFNYSALPLQ